jgi:hypothetical protein
MIDLARNCIRTNEKKTVDKYSAALEQLESAIYNFFLERWPSSITLAGAAEYMLPPGLGDEDLFVLAKSNLPRLLSMTETETITALNEHRDWLKHVQMDKPVSIEIDQDDVIIMIMRAYLRFRLLTQTETPTMLLFKD